MVVSLTSGSVVSARTVDTAAEGQLPIIDSEYHLVEEILAGDPDGVYGEFKRIDADGLAEAIHRYILT